MTKTTDERLEPAEAAVDPGDLDQPAGRPADDPHSKAVEFFQRFEILDAEPGACR